MQVNLIYLLPFFRGHLTNGATWAIWLHDMSWSKENIGSLLPFWYNSKWIWPLSKSMADNRKKNVISFQFLEKHSILKDEKHKWEISYDWWCQNQPWRTSGSRRPSVPMWCLSELPLVLQCRVWKLMYPHSFFK